jgi:hypothetical protein
MYYTACAHNCLPSFPTSLCFFHSQLVKNIPMSARRILWILYLLSFTHRADNSVVHLKRNQRRTNAGKNQHCSLKGATYRSAQARRTEQGFWREHYYWAINDVTTPSTMLHAKRARCAPTLQCAIFRPPIFVSYHMLWKHNRPMRRNVFFRWLCEN